jgi:hypothetical protein
MRLSPHESRCIGRMKVSIWLSAFQIVCLSTAWGQTAPPLQSPGSKFHVPSVPAPAGTDPWGPARSLGIAGNDSYPIPKELAGVDLYRQSKGDAAMKSQSCIHCHTDVGTMHPPNTVSIGCVDCHGGNPFAFTKDRAHVAPRYPSLWLYAPQP